MLSCHVWILYYNCAIMCRAIQCHKGSLHVRTLPPSDTTIKKKITIKVLWHPIITTIGGLTEYFYLLSLSSLILVCCQTFMPLRQNLLHLVRRCACVYCESGFASLVSVSTEWHAVYIPQSSVLTWNIKKIYQREFQRRINRGDMRALL